MRWLIEAPWSWACLGLMLMGVEVVAPGLFLLWVGLAALATAGLLALVPIETPILLLIFSGLAVGSMLIGRALTMRGPEIANTLHRPGEALIGRRFTLREPLLNGTSRLKIDDTIWRLTGPDMVAGADVTVVSIDGTVLHVEPWSLSVK